MCLVPACMCSCTISQSLPFPVSNQEEQSFHHSCIAGKGHFYSTHPSEGKNTASQQWDWGHLHGYALTYQASSSYFRVAWDTTQVHTPPSSSVNNCWTREFTMYHPTIYPVVQCFTRYVVLLVAPVTVNFFSYTSDMAANMSSSFQAFPITFPGIGKNRLETVYNTLKISLRAFTFMPRNMIHVTGQTYVSESPAISHRLVWCSWEKK